MNFVKIKWYGDWYVFKYDENQNLISKKELVNDAVVSELTYTYDSAIQWAKNTLEVKNDYQEGISLLYLIYTILDNQEEIKKYEQKAIANGIKKSQLKRMVKRYL